VVQNQKFPSLLDLVNGIRETHLLLIPCTGSRFFSLFHVQQDDSGYIDSENVANSKSGSVATNNTSNDVEMKDD